MWESLILLLENPRAGKQAAKLDVSSRGSTQGRHVGAVCGAEHNSALYESAVVTVL
jgi:hypothetical protein